MLLLLDGGSPGEMGRGWLNGQDAGLSQEIRLEVLRHGHSAYIQRLHPELLELCDAIIALRPEVHAEVERMCGRKCGQGTPPQIGAHPRPPVRQGHELVDGRSSAGC